MSVQWSPWGSQPTDSVGEGAADWARTAGIRPMRVTAKVVFILT